ncbi:MULTISPECIES: DUF3883 domain-containing protein [Acetobacteraceae]|uniref:DUF3883 domain-containing protein n=1 Tax=Acetobacter suratthaniensis TaxID=1502841 RepID=A0ABS3LQ34_9PROT|nr:DUF3883 domain-containing protein [Gluconobacter japonicus]KXV29029.1 hypothetical protein AD937_01365 [Gluconobacter japonicus]MBO1329477.1 DUF3883 domain-containing protein [Acetobacter suratthaniensis]MCX2567554.1 DUF3883 domain-containing protein [Acetobacter suratthaniensis]
MDEERLLSMSAFEAAYLIRSFREKKPNLSAVEIVVMVKAIRADFYPHDFEAGIVIEGKIPSISLMTEEIFFTSAINGIIAERRPLWARLAPAGRSHVLQAISVNGMQCLRAAGLLGTGARVTDWWDALAAAYRGERDARLLAQGRVGERLSLTYETERLRQEGIARDPVWVALDDNTVGYDILSYAVHGENEVSRLIEVKTTLSDTPRMILSRNEWKTADQFGAAFQFHLWSLPAGLLKILSVEEIRRHIPVDNGLGTWESVEIKFDSDHLSTSC